MNKFDNLYNKTVQLNEEQENNTLRPPVKYAWNPPVHTVSPGGMTKGARKVYDPAVMKDEEEDTYMWTTQQKVMFLKKHFNEETLIRALASYMGNEKFDKFFDFIITHKKEGWMDMVW